MNVQKPTTIAAIATAPGEAGLAVIRISGPDAWDIGYRLFSKKNVLFRPGRFYHGWILDPFALNSQQSPIMVDEVLLLVFQAPQSFTGEDVIEIHCHGGTYVSRKILELCFQAGAQPAGPGEFTKRAFLSGRIDLTQAESIMDLISSQGDAMLQMSSANLRNRSLGQYMDKIGETLVAIQSQIVASVDFPDEVEEPDRRPLLETLFQQIQKVHVLEEASEKNAMLREGLQVAILGMPNSGKSSLFNILLASERAIVTHIAGTTRDIITETLTIAGIPMTLIDTAGIHETDHAIEAMGIARSWQAAEAAQLVLYVFDATVGLRKEDQEILGCLTQAQVQLIANKQDLLTEKQIPHGAIGVSAMSGEGIPEVFQCLEAVVHRSHTSTISDLAIALNRRQRDCLKGISENILDAYETLRNASLPIDLVTVPLTEALRKLDELMGRDTAEEVLTSVFSQFCVGK